MATNAVRFLGGAVLDPSLLPDFSALASADSPALSALLSLACAYLCSEDAAHLQACLEELSTRHALKPKPARGMARTLALVLGGATKFGLAPEALAADMKLLGGWLIFFFPSARISVALCPSPTALLTSPPTLAPPAGFDEARAAQVAAHFAARHEALLQVAADAASDAGALLDAEWRFGVSVSTDDVGRVGSTFVQAKLVVAGEGGGAPVEQFVELSVPQFYDLLSSLEKAQAYTAMLGKV